MRTLNDISNEIRLSISADSRKGALLINGKWGTGKTTFVKTKLQKDIQDICPNCIIGTLFGKNNTQEIYEELIDKAEKENIRKQYTPEEISEMLSNIPILNEKNIDSYNAKKLFEFLIPKNSIIILDDFERINEHIDKDSLYSVIDYLTECNYNVIIICDWEEAKKKNLTSEFEKIIKKEIVFDVDPIEIYNSILEIKSTEAFSEMMLRDDFKEVIQTKNLRTIIYGIDIMQDVYNTIHTSQTQLEDFEYRKFKSIWTFIMAVSTEYKIDVLNANNNMKLDKYINLITNDELELDVDTETENNPFDPDKKDVENNKNDAEKYSLYAKHFTEKYYKPTSEPAIYYDWLYDLIVGKRSIESINPDELDFSLLKKSTGNPAYKILGDIFYNSNKYKENEWFDKLKKLYDFVSESSYNDIISYCNAWFYLSRYSKILEKGLDDIKSCFKSGIQKAILLVDDRQKSELHEMEYKWATDETRFIIDVLKEKYNECNNNKVNIEKENLTLDHIIECLKEPNFKNLELLEDNNKKIMDLFSNIEADEYFRLHNFIYEINKDKEIKINLQDRYNIITNVYRQIIKGLTKRMADIEKVNTVATIEIKRNKIIEKLEAICEKIKLVTHYTPS